MVIEFAKAVAELQARGNTSIVDYRQKLKKKQAEELRRNRIALQQCWTYYFEIIEEYNYAIDYVESEYSDLRCEYKLHLANGKIVEYRFENGLTYKEAHARATAFVKGFMQSKVYNENGE